MQEALAQTRLIACCSGSAAIGLIICKSKDRTIVEYALNEMQKPIGVSTFQLKRQIPSNLQDSLPTIEQLEIELAAVVAEVEEQGAGEA